MSIEADPSSAASIPKASKYGQIEVDAFCVGCHYNLHGQVVTLDERLQIPVCRCPECGRYHPAGVGVSASSVWLRRLATASLTAWVFFVLFFCSMAMWGLGALQVSFVEAFTWVQTLAPNGQQAVMGSTGYVVAGTQTVVNPTFVQTNQPPTSVDPQQIPGIGTTVGISVGSAALGFFLGVLLATFMWHWPRRRYAAGIVLPAIALLFVICIYCNDHQYDSIRRWCIWRMVIQFAIQSGGLMLGARLGRTISRALLRVVIPPKTRQLLAFLWLVDGKQPPMK